MFAKLLKHEWKATAGLLGILSAACIGCGLLGGGAIRYLTWAEEAGPRTDDTLLTVLSALVCATAVIVIAACSIVMLLLLVNRFYKSRFTDEGYLTFTLPVNGHQILLTSVITSVVEMIAICLVVLVSVLLMAFIGVSGVEGFWEEFPVAAARFFQTLREEIGFRAVGYVLLGILVMLSGLVGESCIIMLSVSLGALVAKKHKILLALLFYYLIHMAISIVSVSGLASLSFGVSLESISYSLGMLITAIGWLTIGAVCYFPTHYLITHRLNLP